MRITPRELRGVRRDGLLIRFAMLGPVAYVEVEVPRGGSAGTGFETPSRNPGWGFVLRGHVTLRHRETREFPAGTAFYIPPGTPDHVLTATGGTVVAGFAPVAPTTDTSEAGLRGQGYEPVAITGEATAMPGTIHSMEPSTIFRQAGAVDVETARMGDWLFMRTTFGPLSGYTSGWCDLPHWGLVLRGDFALNSESGVELVSAGDVYYCPAGPPGHQFQVADAATTVDYTPISELDGPCRKADWRWAAWRKARESIGDSVGAPDVEEEAVGGQVAESRDAAGAAPEAPRRLRVLPALPLSMPIELAPAHGTPGRVRWIPARQRGPRAGR